MRISRLHAIALTGALIAGAAAAQTVPVPPGGLPKVMPRPTSTPREFKPVPLILVTPVLAFTGTDDFTKDGTSYRTYKYAVTNKADYPVVLFTPAPTLPPCGTNADASRAWVDVFAAGTDKRLYGFCALDGNKDLGKLSFTLPIGTAVPYAVYIKLTDRKTGAIVTSNTAPTGSAPPPPVIG